MTKGRLEAFSDGVVAILITIMVLELKVPERADWAGLQAVLPKLWYYLLSFVFLGIYWNNHHHMLHVTKKVTGGVLWANLHLLFWLSLVPWLTAWMGQSHLAALPTAAYGVVLLCAAFAYWLLQGRIIAAEGPDSTLAEAVGSDWKGKLSLVFYALAVGAAFWRPWAAVVLYVVVAGMWLVPDRRIEKKITQ